MPRSLIHTVLLTSLLASPAAAQARVADIEGRPGCDSSGYVASPVAISNIADSSALLTAMLRFAKNEQQFSVHIEYYPSGALKDLVVYYADLNKKERKAAADSLRPRFLAIAKQPREWTFQVVAKVNPESGPQLVLIPDWITCQPVLASRDQVQAELSQVAHALAASSPTYQRHQGEVTLQFMVQPDGSTSDIRVKRSSGRPMADSLVVKVFSTARYWPGVMGQLAVPMPIEQKVSL